MASIFHISLYILFPLPMLNITLMIRPPTGLSLIITPVDYNSSDYRSSLQFRTYRDFVLCNNQSSNMELLNEEKGIYGRDTGHMLMSYTVYFELFFVTSLERFRKATNASILPLNNEDAYLYGSKPDPNKGQIIWTANEDHPVSLNACLHLEEDSNLKLVEYFDNNRSRAPEAVWQTYAANKTTYASLVISFEGNLVLFSDTTDPPFVPLWQSFQHPTNTLMVLQVLQKSTTLTIRNDANSSAPNSGNYTMVIENGSLVLYARLWEQDESNYGHGSPYWDWPDSSLVSGGSPPEMTFVALRWDSDHLLRLYAGSNRCCANG